MPELSELEKRLRETYTGIASRHLSDFRAVLAVESVGTWSVSLSYADERVPEAMRDDLARALAKIVEEEMAELRAKPAAQLEGI